MKTSMRVVQVMVVEPSHESSRASRGRTHRGSKAEESVCACSIGDVKPISCGAIPCLGSAMAVLSAEPELLDRFTAALRDLRAEPHEVPTEGETSGILR